VIKVTDMPKVLLSDENIIRPLFNAAIMLFSINTVLMFYLAIYLPRFRGIDSSGYDAYCPRVVPTMTLLGVVCAFLLVRSTWPVWGFLSPLILGIVSLGGLFALHFVPWL